MPEALSADTATRLADFARMVRTAARSVSLYPATHPAIQASLTRVIGVSDRMTAGGPVDIVVRPDTLTIDGRAPARPDAGVRELAELLHARLVGELRVDRGADAADWHAFLLLLARAPEDLIALGGIASAWTATGRAHFDIREIDYASVLRERTSGQAAEWDTVLANCLRADAFELDERTVESLLQMAGDADRFGAFVERVQDHNWEATADERVSVLLRIVRRLLQAATTHAGGAEPLLVSVSRGAGHLTPAMMASLLARATAGVEHEGETAREMVEHIDPATVSTFVARSVVAERGATARLAQAFEALVPDAEQRDPVLDAARDEAARSALGHEAGFDNLWQQAAGMLRSYSDSTFVSDEYGRELSHARTHAVDVERVSDDPPDRIRAWLASITPPAVQALDRQLLLDLLRLEEDPLQWALVGGTVAAEVERLTLAGEAAAAGTLVETIVAEASPAGRSGHHSAAGRILEQLAAGTLIPHVVLHLRTVDDPGVEPLHQLCHTLGPIAIRPLAEALAGEQHQRALLRLREILLAFGAAGRQSVEQLKLSANPAVRRTAVELLRVFGGREALPELASMLDDAEPQVQREAMRAIVSIGTQEAFGVLERALLATEGPVRDGILQQLMALHDPKAVPLLCHVLDRTAPRGRLAEVHLAIIESLGALGPHAHSTAALARVLRGGVWWAPRRTARLRDAAARALERIGSPEALAALADAARTGSRAVRKVARAHAGPAGSPAVERTR